MCREFSKSLRSSGEDSLFGIISGVQLIPLGGTG